MLSRPLRFSAIAWVLLGALASATPAHALPTPVLALAPPATPITAPSVSMEIDGHQVGAFTELVSISTAHDPATKNSRKFSVVVRRPATTNIEFAAWTELGMTDPAAAKKTVTVMLRSGGADRMRFVMTKAFPQKLEYALGKNDVLMETVTMTCELIQRVPV